MWWITLFPRLHLCPEQSGALSSHYFAASWQEDCGTPWSLELVSQNYWWPQISCYISQYTGTCDLCLWTKIQQQCPTKEFHPLLILESCWSIISVDFIRELPDVHRHDAIMNVVDSAGKWGHFIPTTTTTIALGAAWLFLQNVWKLHGLPHSVVSNHGPQFVAEFTWELYQLLGITLSTTTTYYPWGDGQTEWVNQELEQYLQIFVNEHQDDWHELLPLAEFQYNNHVHSRTQQTPFFLDSRQHTCMGFESVTPSWLEMINEFTDQMCSTLSEAKSTLVKAQDDMTHYYNQHSEPAPKYALEDRVYLDGSDIQTTQPFKNLAHQFLPIHGSISGWTPCLLILTALVHEPVAPSLRGGQTHACTCGSNSGKAEQPTFQPSSCWWRERIWSWDHTGQPHIPGTTPISHLMERVWLWTQ